MRLEAKAAAKEEAERITAELKEQDAINQANAAKEAKKEEAAAKKAKGKKTNKKEEAAPAKQETPKPA